MSIFFVLFTYLSATEEPIQIGFSLLNEKKLTEANEIFQSLQLDDNPTIRDFAYLGMAKIDLEKGALFEAEKALEKIGQPNRFIPLDLKRELIYTSADLLFRQENLDNAEKLLLSLKAESKRDLLLAQIYLKKGDLQSAEAYFLKANRDDTISSFILLGKEAYERGLFHLAARYFEKANLRVEQIKALIQENTPDSIQIGLELLESIPPSEKIPLQAALLAKKGETKEALALLKNEKTSEKNLFLIGSYLYEEKSYDEALLAFQQLLENYPHSALKADTLFWLGKIPSSKSKSYYQALYEQFPEHPLAPEGYFNSYSLQEYLLGDKNALKHLKDFKNRFPKTPLLLHAFYLEGLDFLRDRKSPQGKWISRQNLTAAIDAFQSAESLFNGDENFALLRDQAALERAKANLAIAKLSKTAKKAIYCDYAEELFHSLNARFASDHPLLEETLYFLALTQLEAGKNADAIVTLKKIQGGYYLALALYQEGVLKQEIDLLNKALEVGTPYLSNDEKLTVMLEKSNYYRKRGELDDAMLQLSEVVNSETASSLRLKAMFQRAEIYAEQGRHPLAQKQLESIALKGGDWAQKAKEKLEKEYEY